MNSLVVHQHHQSIQMYSQNLMLKQILATIGVNVPPHISDVPGFTSFTKNSTTSTYDITNPPTYVQLRRHLLPEK